MKRILSLLLFFSPYFLKAQTQITVPITNGNDDIEVGAIQTYTASTDLDMGGFDANIGGTQYVALRFANVALPPNAQITKAYIQFTTLATNPATANMTIKCQQGNALAYTSGENLLLRTYVSNVLTWNPSSWTVVGEKGVNQQTANLAIQVQAAIASGWTSGGALSFILQGNATQDNILNANSYETVAATHAGAPELVIQYTTTTNTCSPDVTPPTIVGCPANINLTTATTTGIAFWATPTVTDNCTAGITPSVTSSPIAGLGSGSAFAIGTTTLTYNAKDAANNNAVPCIFTVTVTGGGGGGTTLRVPVIDGNDDVEVSNVMYATSSDLEVGGFDTGNVGAQYVAIRFQNVTLPANAQVSKAYIQFTTKAVNTVSANVSIKCQQGNAAPYVTTENLLQRTYTAPVVTWNPPAWTVLDATGVNQQTANLSAQVQAAIASGWASGNALSFILQGNATINDVLNARSYENNATHAGAPELVIEYTLGSNLCSPDVVPPSLSACPANINLTTTGTTAVATWTAPIVSDNCTAGITPSVTSSPTTGLIRGSAFPIGTTTVTYNAKDAANNNAVPCFFTVTVSTTNPCSPDVTPPVITACPANINLTTTGTTAVATWTVPTVIDNCTGITPSVTSSPTAGLTRGSAFPIGTTTVTYNAKDAANNNAVPCIFTVTVATANPCSPDVTPPAFTNCPANINLTTTGTTAVATWTTPTVTDNCTTGIAPTFSSSPTVGLVSGSAFPIGTTTITYNAKDAANNNAVPCVFTVTVATSGGTTTLRVPVIDGNDDVEVSTVMYTASSDLEVGGFDSSNNGAQYVAIRFQNVALPTNAQVSKAYIQFTTKAVNTVSTNMTIKCQQGNAAAYLTTENLLQRLYVTPVVAWNPPAWTVLDVAGVNQQTANLSAQVQAAIASGWSSGNALSFVLQGNATIDDVLNARSYENNATHAGAPELVIEYTTGSNPCSPDVVAPALTGCPANISLTTTGTTAVATWTVPTVTDNCTTGITPSVTSSPTVGLTRGSAFPIGTTTVTYNAKDAANNNAVPCTFTVTVSAPNPCAPDVTPPALTGCPANISLTTLTTTAVATWTVPTVADNCTTGITPSVTSSPTAGLTRGSAFPIGTTTVTYNAKDAANNNAIACIFTVTVSAINPCAPDVTPPTITSCPANISLTTTGSLVVALWTPPTITDNCAGTITTTVTSSPTTGLTRGSAFPVGVTAITYNAKDAANNSAIPCAFTVTVSVLSTCAPDVTPPTFVNCPANISLTTTTATAVATWATPTVTDNCTTGIAPTFSSAPTVGLTSGSAFPLGKTTMTYNAKDAANNNAIPCLFTVTVTAPTSTLFINEVAPQGTIAITSDWIEIYNDATTPAPLTDVYITNKVATPFKASLAGLTVPAKGFLLLYADNLPTLGINHLNFKVSASGEKIYLNRMVNGAAVQLSFIETPLSPAEEDNVTFGGLVEGQQPPAPAALTKFLGGTPVAANAGGLRYVKVGNTLTRGILTTTSTATLTAPAGNTIRYTTDNTTPTRTNGTIYTTPLSISTTTVLKVFAYSANSESKPEAYTYIFPVKGLELKFPELVTATEYSNGMKLLPIISISTTIESADTRIEKAATFEYIKKFGEVGSVGVTCGVNGYGNDSYTSDQKNMRLHFKNQYGYGNLEFPIFTKDAVDSYNPVTKFDVLDLKIGQDGPSSDGFGMIMTSQELYSKTMREMGNIDVHTQFVHAFVNGKYHGIYILKEHWDAHFGESYYGGNKDLYDEIDDTNGWANGAVNLNSEGVPQGTIANWNAMRTAAEITNLQAVKTLLNVKQYIDLMLNVMYFDAQWEFRAFADQSLVATKFVIENHDIDGALIKTSDEYITTHDFKWLKTIDYEEVLNGPGGVFGNLYRGNKEFRTMVKDRVRETMQLSTGALTVSRMTTKLNEIKSVIRPVFNMELARFNATFYNNNPYFDQEFDANIAYLPTRFNFTLAKWLENGLAHSLPLVVFNQPSGSTVTTPVTATNPFFKGVIYYTNNGTDPMGLDGNINPAAFLYTNRLALNVGVNNIVARIYFNSEWGPKATATYTSATVVPAAQVAQILVAHVRLDGQKAVVSWVSKTSKGVDYFNVEKLNARGLFDKKASINAQSSNQPDILENYSWTDENLVEGENIYRVSLHSDALRTPQYSDLVHLKYIPADAYSIFPNPTSDFFDIDLKSVEGTPVDVSIFNNIGTVVLTKRIEKAGITERVNIEKLGTGQYQVVVQPQGKRVVMRKVSVVR
jgi:HYR domain/Secretion system C-terminal sorting domain/Fn3 associated/CotH kinase protein